jgi:quercetin dioxygenase-like cupin family protein
MKPTFYHLTLLATVTTLLLATASAIAQTPAHVMSGVADAKWGPAPPLVPAGAQIAVLSGDPGKAAPYTVRLKFPANYAIPAHSHPGDENVVVVTGTLFMGKGDTLNKAGAMALGAGGYAFIPANSNHYAFTKGETTIVLYGVGPLDFKYVNSADDPRNATKTTK